MKNRFEPNDMVMYGGHGVCTLVEITERDFGGEAKSYYVLRPAYSGSSVFYVPIDSETLTAKLRPIKSAEEIRRVVRESEPFDWIVEDRARQNYLKQVVDGGGTEQLVSAYKRLYTRQKELTEIGKKLRAADDRYMRDVEKLLLEEFFASFEMQKEDLVPFLFAECEPAEKAEA